MNNSDYEDMLSKRLITVLPASCWLERAIEQHNSRVTLQLADSINYTLDSLDKKFATKWLCYDRARSCAN